MTSMNPCFTTCLQTSQYAVCVLSRVRLFEAPWTVTHQTPLPMEFSNQKYWSGVPFPIPGDLPTPGINVVITISIDLNA